MLKSVKNFINPKNIRTFAAEIKQIIGGIKMTHKVQLTLNVTISTDNKEFTQEEIEGKAYWLVQPAIENVQGIENADCTITDFNLQVVENETEMNI